MPEDTAILSSETPPLAERTLPPLWPVATVMATGIFATTFVQLQGLGYFPFLALLKDHFGLQEEPAQTFISLATLPWSFKPLAGLLIDGFPILGTRRRWYLLLSALSAVFLWLLMSTVVNHYYPLLLMALAMNIAIVFGSVASGGLLVEAGQRYRATGRLSSLRVAAQNLGAALGLPVGGFLAGKAMGLTGLAAAAPLLALFIATLFLLHEPERAGRSEDFWRTTWLQLKNVFRSRTLWYAAGVILLLQAMPGFRGTPLTYYQKGRGFTYQFLGIVGLLGYAGGMLSGLAYALVCRKLPLRVSLYGACVLAALSALPYLGYSPHVSKTAVIIIEVVSQFALYLAYLPLFDLAVRATPKGSEALGYSVLISFWNIGLMISNQSGASLYQRVFNRGLSQLVWLNAGCTLLVAAAVIVLPRVLVDRREGTA